MRFCTEFFVEIQSIVCVPALLCSYHDEGFFCRVSSISQSEMTRISVKTLTD